jgi:hypothetical protein
MMLRADADIGGGALFATYVLDDAGGLLIHHKTTSESEHS